MRNKANIFQRARLGLGYVLGFYEAARWHSKRGFWWCGTRSQDAWRDMDKSTLETIRHESKHLEHNDWLSNKLAQVFCQYVVGSDGLQLTPGSSDAEFNEWAADEWAVAQQFVDVETTAGFGDFQWRSAWRRFFDGDAFWYKIKSANGNGRLQLIESHRIKNPEGVEDGPRKDGGGISNGVQYDRAGRVVRYYVATGTDSGKVETIEASLIIPVIDRTRARQFRGMPHLTPVINAIADLRILEGLEIDKAKETASRALAIKTENGEMPDEELLRASELVTSGDSNIGQDTETRTKHIREVTGSSVFALRPGEDIESIASNSPSAATQWLWEMKIGMICAGAGISKLLVMPWSLQGTVTRADLDSQAQIFRAQSAIEGNAAREAYKFIIGTALPRYKGRKPVDWWKANVRPPRSVNVDVGRNSNAALQELKAGLRTFQSLYSELGLDWKSELKQRAEEVKAIQQLADDLGVDANLISDIVVQQISAQQPQGQQA